MSTDFGDFSNEKVLPNSMSTMNQETEKMRRVQMEKDRNLQTQNMPF